MTRAPTAPACASGSRRPRPTRSARCCGPGSTARAAASRARERQVAALGQEVAYGTVELSVQGEKRSGAAAAGGRWTPGDALGDAGRVLEVVVGVLVIALAVLLPLAILAALAGARRAPRDPPPARAGARSGLTVECARRPVVVDPTDRDGEHTRNGRAPQPGAGLRAAGGPRPRAGGRGLPPAALRRGRDRLPRGRPVEHVLRRPHRSRAGGARARGRAPDRARDVRPVRHLRRAGDVRRRAPLGHRRGDRPARGAGDPRPRHAPGDAEPPAAGGVAGRFALAPPADDQRAARQPVLPDRPEPGGGRDRPARRPGPRRGRARHRRARSPPRRPTWRCWPGPRASPRRGSWRRSNGQA